MRALLLFVIVTSPARAADYDPLRVDPEFAPRTLDLVVRDAGRDREIPVLVYLPAGRGPSPVVLFSHGLGGARTGSVFLAEHWAARGYVAVFLQHHGSDDGVWRDVPLLQRMAAMRRAATARNLLLRVGDVPAVLDQLAVWNDQSGHGLKGRLDSKRIAMSGHSFGAVTTQSVSGQSQAGRARHTDRRIRAAIAFSPSSPRVGNVDRAFANVRIPWLLMTGTKDTSPIGGQTVESRLAVFPALPAGGKYELVLDRAEHSAFTDRRLPGDRERRNPNHHRAILAVSTAFLDAHLRGNAPAREWLDGDGPPSVLEKADRWRRK